jgi:hypothetical protein
MCLLQRITLYVLYGMSKGSTEPPRAHRATASGNSDVGLAQNVTEGDGLAGINAPAEIRCIFIATAQAVDALPHQVGQRMIHLALLASILKTTAQRLNQTIAKAPVGSREQNRATITAAM